MRIFKNLVAAPRKIVGGVVERVRGTVHRVLDRLEDVIGGPDRHLATSPSSPTPAKRIAKLRGHKKPRAERRKARRATQG